MAHPAACGVAAHAVNAIVIQAFAGLVTGQTLFLARETLSFGAVVIISAFGFIEACGCACRLYAAVGRAVDGATVVTLSAGVADAAGIFTMKDVVNTFGPPTAGGAKRFVRK